MIWFGKLERFFVGPVPEGLPAAAEDKRMQLALERVAEVAPGLSGERLIDALEATGWVDRPTANRLLPTFRFFDPDRHFSEYLRRLSFRGRPVEEEFRSAVRGVVEDLTGSAIIDPSGPEACVRFTAGGREGVMLAQPEVGFTIAGRTRDAIVAAIEEMPDTLVVVARTFDRNAADQLRTLLRNTGIAGTLITVNLLLGMRAAALRYQPSAECIMAVLSHGGTLRSSDIAILSERPQLPLHRFHISGWKSSSTV